jgi:hypothetical protein
MLKDIFDKTVKTSEEYTKKFLDLADSFRKSIRNSKLKKSKVPKIIGVIIGIILLLSVPLLYFYILPENMLIPLGFKNDLQGHTTVWTIISGKEKYDSIIRGEVLEVNTETKEALVYRGLLDSATERPINILFDFLNISEWLYIDARLNSLRFSRVDDGYFLIPGINIPGSPIREGDIVEYTFAESNGVRGGEERIQIVMKLKNIGKEEVNGLTLWIWEGKGDKEPLYMHGINLYLTYIIRFAVEPTSGYPVYTYLKFDFYCTPLNLWDILKDERVKLKDILDKLKNRFFGLFRNKRTREDIRSMDLSEIESKLNIDMYFHIATLDFESSKESLEKCISEAKEAKSLVLFINPGLGYILSTIGIILLWGSTGFYLMSFLRKRK